MNVDERTAGMGKTLRDFIQSQNVLVMCACVCIVARRHFDECYLSLFAYIFIADVKRYHVRF